MRNVILSVEDDDITFALLEIAIHEGGKPCQLIRVKDGEEALCVLRGEHEYADAPRPDLIISNINMPKMDGFESLTAIKREHSLRSIPVVIFTSSALDSDKTRCLALGAKAFFTKPSGIDQWIRTIHSACALAAGA